MLPPGRRDPVPLALVLGVLGLHRILERRLPGAKPRESTDLVSGPRRPLLHRGLLRVREKNSGRVVHPSTLWGGTERTTGRERSRRLASWCASGCHPAARPHSAQSARASLAGSARCGGSKW